MTDYKKLYAFLVGKIDEALTVMDTGDLLQYDRVRELLHAALLEAEDRAIDGQEDA